MNSDAKRILRPYDHNHNLNGPEFVNAFYPQQDQWGRLGSSGFVVSIIVLASTAIYQLLARNRPSRPLVDLVWDALVASIPARILFAIDDWVNPSLFSKSDAMLQARSRSHEAKKEILRRLLGMDRPGGIMMTVSQASRRGISSFSTASLGPKVAADYPPGLGNFDNSCYQNSILQGLASLKPLPSYLSVIPSLQTRCDERLIKTDTLRDLIAELNAPSNNGRTLWTPSVLKNMSTWQQQDAQEYFSRLLEEIDKEQGKAVKTLQRPSGLNGHLWNKDDTATSQHSDDSGYQSQSAHAKVGSALDPRLLRNPLEGLAAQRVVCVSCKHSDGLSLIPFNCLTLSLGLDQTEHDLYERLDSYTKLEAIEGVVCAKCSLVKYQRLLRRLIEMSRVAGKTDGELVPTLDRLNVTETALQEDNFDDATLTEKCQIRPENRVNSTKTKQVVIARPPQSLVIHVNRSVFDERDGSTWKNLASVRFPSILDLGPWVLGSADGKTDEESSFDDAAAAMERWVMDPLRSMVAGDRVPSRISGPIYELRAVVTHQGRHENGHYICYRKYPRPARTFSGAEGRSEKPSLVAGNRAPRRDSEDPSLSDGRTSALGADETPNSEPTSPGHDTMCESKDENNESKGQWWRLSDQDVMKVDEATVLAQGGVFMLFYDCLDSNLVFCSGAEDPSDAHSSNKKTPSSCSDHDRNEEAFATTAEMHAQEEEPAQPTTQHMQDKKKFEQDERWEMARTVSLPEDAP